MKRTSRNAKGGSGKGQVPFHAPAYAAIFCLANLAIASPSLPVAAKLWIGILGIFLPLAVGGHAIWKARGRKALPPSARPQDDWIPSWLGWSFLALLLLTRFYRLTGLPFWPVSDEGIFATLGISLQDHWDWNLLWAEARMEPLLIWLLGFYFRVVDPSLPALRIFTTLISLGVVVLAYIAARRFFDRPLSFGFAWILGFSFWEFSLARFCTPNDLIPFLQLGAFYWLGRALEAKDPRNRWTFWVILSLWTGLGFYAFVNWAVVWAMLALVLALLARRGGKGPGLLFLGVTLSLALPLLLARLAPGSMTIIHGYFHDWFSLRSYGLYLVGLFWDGKAAYPMGPIQGGMLDPLTGALVMTGWLVLLRSGQWKLWVLTLVFFGFALQPGVVTNGLELHRITPALPWLALWAAWGLQGVVTSFPRSIPALRPVLLTGILAWNAYAYFGPYCDIRLSPPDRQWRSVQYWDAYRVLKDRYEKEGPLYLFTEFNTDYDNKTLDLATYPWNALRKPPRDKPGWVAIVTKAPYAPYLARQFPGLKFKMLATDKTAPGDPKPFTLFLFPLGQLDPAALERWIASDRIYRQVDFKIKNRSSVQSWESFLMDMAPLEGLSQGDRFLTAVYWEKVAFFHYLNGNFREAAQAYEKAIAGGVEAEHLYYDLGLCYHFTGHAVEAERNLKKARRLARLLQAHGGKPPNK